MKKRFLISPITILTFIGCVITDCLYSQAFETKKDAKIVAYRCLPCGYDCDKVAYNQPGECPTCHMQLVKKSSVTFKSIEPSDICNYINKHPAVILLDVRTKEEFEGKANPDFGTLKNAINIPVQ